MIAVGAAITVGKIASSLLGVIRLHKAGKRSGSTNPYIISWDDEGIPQRIKFFKKDLSDAPGWVKSMRGVK